MGNSGTRKRTIRAPISHSPRRDGGTSQAGGERFARQWQNNVQLMNAALRPAGKNRREYRRLNSEPRDESVQLADIEPGTSNISGSPAESLFIGKSLRERGARIMHVITRKRLNEFAVNLPDAKSALCVLYAIMRKGQFSNLAQIREIFPPR